MTADRRNSHPSPGGGSLWGRGGTRIRVMVALAALVAAALAFRTALLPSGPSPSAVRTSPSIMATAPNLLPFSMFHIDRQHPGIAEGLVVWGASSFALAANPEFDGRLAQQVDVRPGERGGAWFEVSARAGTTYTQSVSLRVLALSPGAQVELILKWYSASEELLGYQTEPISTTDAHYTHRFQTATAPLHTARVRFAVNIVGGGSYVMDAPVLNVGTTASP
ncbi:MAG TPA: hypothetical protein VND70_08555 [Acidimicrobiales bacterium]|nr:hypothetical protein [Acidimicrobiales bacterium]